MGMPHAWIRVRAHTQSFQLCLQPSASVAVKPREADWCDDCVAAMQLVGDRGGPGCLVQQIWTGDACQGEPCPCRRHVGVGVIESVCSTVLVAHWRVIAGTSDLECWSRLVTTMCSSVSMLLHWDIDTLASMRAGSTGSTQTPFSALSLAGQAGCRWQVLSVEAPTFLTFAPITAPPVDHVQQPQDAQA